DPGLLTARSFDAHPPGTADLCGLRLAVLHETDAGRHLAEGTVKRLTGGDRLKARRMREDFWSFDPSHTFVMLTNHKPIVTGTDEGIWRRIRLVPWTVVIPADQRDEQLGDQLALEADAVLAWMVDGYRSWRQQGMSEPGAVQQATAAYRDESDAIQRFLDERCVTGPGASVQSSHLFAAWERWCAVEGEQPDTAKAFATELQKRGHDKERTRTGAVWRGLGLGSEEK